MEIKRAIDVNKSSFYAFISQYDACTDEVQFTRGMSYVVEEEGRVLSWFQLEPLQPHCFWLKKMFILQEEALKLPEMLHVILQFSKEKGADKLYANSKQLVTDLLFRSFSFTLQASEELEAFQLSEEGNWWCYSFQELAGA